jgi:hypothetical protein
MFVIVFSSTFLLSIMKAKRSMREDAQLGNQAQPFAPLAFVGKAFFV